jgi:uncharacterized protein YndB with AHSA1/START domain
MEHDEQATDTESASRVIDLSVEVVGTPEQVWAAIATGPGISSWFVPSTVEEHEGGATTSRFGEGPEMLIPGRVTVWDPPRRVVFDGAGADSDLAFEWLVEARGQGTCIVRLVNSGFGSGDEWDAQYDGMSQGWRLFLDNLQLHLAHFAGQTGIAMLPMAMWSGPRSQTWAALTRALGVPATPSPGERVEAANDSPRLAGTVVEVGPWRLSLLLDEPAPGTAILAAEGDGEQVGVSVWLYLYGPDAATVVARDGPAWSAWLTARA